MPVCRAFCADDWIGPKWRAKSICWSSVSFWSRKTTIAYRLIAASIASRSAGLSGWARSRPEISATKSGVTGFTVMLMTVSCGYSGF